MTKKSTNHTPCIQWFGYWIWMLIHIAAAVKAMLKPMQ